MAGATFDDIYRGSSLLDLNATTDVPGVVGDDDGDWLGPESFFVPDREELSTDDDLVVHTLVDYGTTLMRDTDRLQIPELDPSWRQPYP